MNLRFPAVVSAALALGLTLVSCSAADAPNPTPTPTATASESPQTPAPEPVTSEPADDPQADPTCETMITPSTIEIFDEHGWTYEEQEFRLSSGVVEDGVHCVWGDYSVASDHVQVFGWAPLGDSESVSEQQALIAEGWIRADEDGRTYVTEDPTFSMAVDEDGYGMTYEFGEGWVAVADTKQSLVLITFPPDS